MSSCQTCEADAGGEGMVVKSPLERKVTLRREFWSKNKKKIQNKINEA